MLAALYVATGKELPEDYKVGGQYVNDYIYNDVDMGRDIIDMFGLDYNHQEELANAGDRAVESFENILSNNWDEPAIVNALLAEVDRMEAGNAP